MHSRNWMALTLFAGLAGGWTGAGQPPSGVGSDREFETIRASELPTTMQARFRAIGSRLQSGGSARITYGGVLRDGRGSRPIEVTIQNPGLVRIVEGGTGARVTSFDGARVLSTTGPLAAEQQKLMETLVLDTPESVFQQLASGEAFRRIGGGHKVAGSGAGGKAVEYVDVYQLFPRGRAVKARPGATVRFLAFDSSTLMLKYVSYRDPEGRAVSSQFDDWKTAGTERYAGRIRRMENGVEVLSIEIQVVQVGGRLNAAGF